MPFFLSSYIKLSTAPRQNDTAQRTAQGQYHGFDAYGVQSFDDLLVAANFNAEDEQQRPD